MKKHRRCKYDKLLNDICRICFAFLGSILYSLYVEYSFMFTVYIAMKPKSIKKTTSGDITILWENEHSSKYPLGFLRRICPCAGCQGETVLLHHYPAQINIEDPNSIGLINIEQVGSYAIRIQWSDGHNSGIYTWNHLLDNCPCDICRDKNNISTN